VILLGRDVGDSRFGNVVLSLVVEMGVACVCALVGVETCYCGLGICVCCWEWVCGLLSWVLFVAIER
jgi:hypothetical protein